MWNHNLEDTSGRLVWLGNHIRNEESRYEAAFEQNVHYSHVGEYAETGGENYCDKDQPAS